MLTVVTSGKAAPGASTTTWALGFAWPRPVMLADCDPTGGDLAAGLLAGRVALDRGVLSWLTATRRAHPAEAAAMFAQHVIEVPEGPDTWLLAGVRHNVQGASFSASGWERLAAASQLSAASLGRDVIVDTGRLSEASCWPVLRAADQIVLTVRPTIRSVHAATAACVRMAEVLGDLHTVGAVVIGEGPYSPTEVVGSLSVPLWGVLPDDTVTAQAFSDGLTMKVRRFERTKLVRDADAVVQSMLSRPELRATADANFAGSGVSFP